MNMATVNVCNAMATALRMRVFTPITDNLVNEGDIVVQQQRHIPTNQPINDIVLPGGNQITAIDATFWSQWLAQNAQSAFVLNHQIFQV
jgi:hypothetical protein